MTRHDRSSHPVARALAPGSMTPLVAVAMSVVIALSVGSAPSGQQVGTASRTRLAPAAASFDPEVVLPARVEAALHRSLSLLDRAVAAVDNRQWVEARRALLTASVGFISANKAVLHQVLAGTDADAQKESTAGPDSALAGLKVAQVSIGELAGLFGEIRGAAVARSIGTTLRATQVKRAELLAVLVGLGSEGDGADYADALTDTVPSYVAELASIQEALADDRLTGTARTALQAALIRSQAAEAAMNAAHAGGGERSAGVG
jgi:hypothetical protein